MVPPQINTNVASYTNAWCASNKFLQICFFHIISNRISLPPSSCKEHSTSMHHFVFCVFSILHTKNAAGFANWTSEKVDWCLLKGHRWLDAILRQQSQANLWISLHPECDVLPSLVLSPKTPKWTHLRFQLATINPPENPPAFTENPAALVFQAHLSLGVKHVCFLKSYFSQLKIGGWKNCGFESCIYNKPNVFLATLSTLMEVENWQIAGGETGTKLHWGFGNKRAYFQPHTIRNSCKLHMLKLTYHLQKPSQKHLLAISVFGRVNIMS